MSGRNSVARNKIAKNRKLFWQLKSAFKTLRGTVGCRPSFGVLIRLNLGNADFILWSVLEIPSGSKLPLSGGTLSRALLGLCLPCEAKAGPASGKPPLYPALRGLLCLATPALLGAVGIDAILPYFLFLISYFLFQRNR